MEIITTTLGEVWKVALGALILGAGLPIVFSLGLKSLYGSQTVAARADGGTTITGGTGAAGKVGAVVCFGIVVAAILFGVVVLIWGKQMFGK
ncbi:hypothetical protein FHX74_003148 [Friedmanniella endophytica]|uniref:Uncharacterized protein n=1 Tax=Microlunatus kandeliicorticis TaxID=1759536 RepID=A0A7W3IUH4_9ACTN|nr:hypothetical protein [Microlunatus kandeliicorticis]MBA8795512.1 hypothetical protein [Microlunatus kandeliicorticis]